MTTDLEIWKDIQGYEGLYQISNHGRVKSLPRGKKGKIRILKPHSGGGGTRRNPYRGAILCKLGKPKTFTIHRLVAQAFLPNPEGKKEVNHKDAKRSNNHATNLEWTTKQENDEHAVWMNLYLHKMEKIEVATIGNRIHLGEAGTSIAKDYGLTSGAIYKIRRVYYRGWRLFLECGKGI